MFFYLSKISWLFIQPLNLTIILLLAGLLAAAFGRRRLAAGGCGLGLLVFVLSAWTTLGAVLLNPLDERFPRPPLPAKVDGILVLGGGLNGDVNKVRGGYEMNAAGERFVEAVILARRFPAAKVAVSGGSASLSGNDEGDAVTALRLLAALGVSEDRLILENRSRDTYENAVFSKQLIQPKPGETWLLVTSAFHMPRAKALFDKAGFQTIPWPVDYRTTGKEGFGLAYDDQLNALSITNTAVREWVGLLAYWLSGRIDQPFPGPGG